MTTVYTVGIWTVKPGRENDFVAMWRGLGENTLADFPHARGTLVRHREHANRFVSFGPWSSPEEVARWRESAAFVNALSEMQDVLEEFVPGTYDLVVDTGQP